MKPIVAVAMASLNARSDRHVAQLSRRWQVVLAALDLPHSAEVTEVRMRPLQSTVQVDPEAIG